MTDDSLYRREVLRLAADAMGAGHLPAPGCRGHGHNPACGDRVTVELAMDKGPRDRPRPCDPGLCPDPGLGGAAGVPGAGPDQGRAGGAGEGSPGFQGPRCLKGGTAPEGYGVFDGVAAHAGRHICVLLPLEAALKALESAEKGAGAAKGQPAS